jgi:predicted ATPase
VIVSHLALKNWRNFQRADVELRERSFIVGPNASGKSNLLDVFRFLRDVAIPEGGGLQKAIADRGGISKIRSLAARRDPEVSIQIDLAQAEDSPPIWRYALGIKQETRGRRLPFLTYEHVWHGDRQIVKRPDADDKTDPDRLTQTFLEQINSNREFREVAQFLQGITYLHLVPQLLRHAASIRGRVLERDPFGQGFLERVARTQEATRRSRLGRIQKALQIAVPQLENLEYAPDKATGAPHLQALYSHWRKGAGYQQEDQFSDGTLRLIGLLWSLLEGESLLLLEEPELSLNSAIVRQFAPLIQRIQSVRRRRQVLLTTHSEALLSDPGIDGREVLFLEPNREGTDVTAASDIEEIRALLQSGLSAGDVVLPRVRPAEPDRLSSIG